MAQRTTLVLDERTRRAARDLARRYDCSTSEAIRRAIVKQLEAESKPSVAERKRRRDVLQRLFELFEDTDVAAEIRRLKAEDAGF
jgi:hypothetical protein